MSINDKGNTKSSKESTELKEKSLVFNRNNQVNANTPNDVTYSTAPAVQTTITSSPKQILFQGEVTGIDKIMLLGLLSISDEKKKKYIQQIDEIINEFLLNNGKRNDNNPLLDITEVEPSFNVSGQSNVMGGDEPVAGLSQDEALQNAQTKNGFFVTKGVINND